MQRDYDGRAEGCLGEEDAFEHLMARGADFAARAITLIWRRATRAARGTVRSRSTARAPTHRCPRPTRHYRRGYVPTVGMPVGTYGWVHRRQWAFVRRLARDDDLRRHTNKSGSRCDPLLSLHAAAKARNVRDFASCHACDGSMPIGEKRELRLACSLDLVFLEPLVKWPQLLRGARTIGISIRGRSFDQPCWKKERENVLRLRADGE